MVYSLKRVVLSALWHISRIAQSRRAAEPQTASRTSVDAQVVRDLLLLTLARLAPSQDHQPCHLVHDAPAQRAPPLRKRVEPTLRDVEHALRQRLRHALFAHALSEGGREVDAVPVEDVVCVGVPCGIEIGDERIDLRLAECRRPEVNRHLRAVAQHLLHDRHSSDLNVVRVKVLDAVDADADVRNHRQPLCDRFGHHIGKRPSNLVEGREHIRRVSSCRCRHGRDLIHIPQLPKEGRALDAHRFPRAHMRAVGRQVLVCGSARCLLILLGCEAASLRPGLLVRSCLVVAGLHAELHGTCGARNRCVRHRRRAPPSGMEGDGGREYREHQSQDR
mmetsp:Transcript_11406/g.23197  ORF Transcript_11406/g.23197 Transcript_11406/m.23197 type:complete len:334 (+) Transcript_11406:124-1125(+)